MKKDGQDMFDSMMNVSDLPDSLTDPVLYQQKQNIENALNITSSQTLADSVVVPGIYLSNSQNDQAELYQKFIEKLSKLPNKQ